MDAARTDSLYPPLTASLVKRGRLDALLGGPVLASRPPFPRRGELAADAKLFTMTWAGAFVFVLTFIA